MYLYNLISDYDKLYWMYRYKFKQVLEQMGHFLKQISELRIEFSKSKAEVETKEDAVEKIKQEIRRILKKVNIIENTCKFLFYIHLLSYS